MSITQCDHGPLALSHHHSAAAAQEEVSTQWGYSIDAEVSSRGLRIAVEADGPLHFFGRVPTGATVMKRRQVWAWVKGQNVVWVSDEHGVESPKLGRCATSAGA